MARWYRPRSEVPQIAEVGIRGGLQTLLSGEERGGPPSGEEGGRGAGLPPLCARGGRPVPPQPGAPLDSNNGESERVMLAGDVDSLANVHTLTRQLCMGTEDMYTSVAFWPPLATASPPHNRRISPTSSLA